MPGGVAGDTELETTRPYADLRSVRLAIFAWQRPRIGLEEISEVAGEFIAQGQDPLAPTGIRLAGALCSS